MTPPFEDMAYSLYLFIKRLHAQTTSKKVNDLYFFSREGKMLKDMFDLFLDQSKQPSRIRTHYLEVSRRSTFLPSLAELENEPFEVLFRQYPRISLNAFLKSLALDEYRDTLVSETHISHTQFDTVHDDLPTSAPFQRLLSDRVFQKLYHDERSARAKALAAYVASFTGGVLPNTLHVVDVGWKGSIQDNLFNWFQRTAGTEVSVQGYYVGLIAKGLASERNRKVGLLFSSVPHRTPGFHIFNENRSLFEVLLPACHGGPRSYKFQNGKPSVVKDPFDEERMIAALVTPVANAILEKFKQITAEKYATDEQLSADACKRHARMVFKPKDNEMSWMLSVSHVENFGIFEKSHFGKADTRSTLIERCRYTWNLFARRQLDDPGFWPYLTLRQRSLAGVSALYRAFRKLQNRSALLSAERGS